MDCSRRLLLVAALVGCAFPPVRCSHAVDGFGTAQHVLIVGLDGLDLRCLHKAMDSGLTPNIQHLRENGAFTEECRSEQPTVSLPNWATIFFGAGTSFHGIDSNEWKIGSNPRVSSILDGKCKHYPNIFTIAKMNSPQFSSSVFYTWDGLDNLFHPKKDIAKRYYQKALTCEDTITASNNITEEAVAYLKQHKPNITFVYMGEIDECAHSYTCFSQQGQDAIKNTDDNIAKLLQALEDAGMVQDTLVVLVSDHGRDASGKSHGQFETTQVLTQWVVYGAGVQRGRRIVSAVSLEDNSPTIIHALGLRFPVEWHGKPVLEAFSSNRQSLYWVASEAMAQDKQCLSARTNALAYETPTRWWYLGAIIGSVALLLVLTVRRVHCSACRTSYTPIE